MIIWEIKIIRISGTILSKQNCLRLKFLQRVGINHDNRKSLLSGLAVLLCSADYERVKRVFSPEHLEAAWEAGKQLRRSVNWEGNGKRVYLQVKL